MLTSLVLCTSCLSSSPCGLFVVYFGVLVLRDPHALQGTGHYCAASLLGSFKVLPTPIRASLWVNNGKHFLLCRRDNQTAEVISSSLRKNIQIYSLAPQHRHPDPYSSCDRHGSMSLCQFLDVGGRLAPTAAAAPTLLYHELTARTADILPPHAVMSLAACGKYATMQY